MSENGKVINMATGDAVVCFCHVCGFEVENIEQGCPNALNHASHQEELPPLGVFVSEKVGASGKVGR